MVRRCGLSDLRIGSIYTAPFRRIIEGEASNERLQRREGAGRRLLDPSPPLCRLSAVGWGKNDCIKAFWRSISIVHTSDRSSVNAR